MHFIIAAAPPTSHVHCTNARVSTGPARPCGGPLTQSSSCSASSNVSTARRAEHSRAPAARRPPPATAPGRGAARRRPRAPVLPALPAVSQHHLAVLHGAAAGHGGLGELRPGGPAALGGAARGLPLGDAAPWRSCRSLIPSRMPRAAASLACHVLCFAASATCSATSIVCSNTACVTASQLAASARAAKRWRSAAHSMCMRYVTLPCTWILSRSRIA